MSDHTRIFKQSGLIIKSQLDLIKKSKKINQYFGTKIVPYFDDGVQDQVYNAVKIYLMTYGISEKVAKSMAESFADSNAYLIRNILDGWKSED